MKNKRNLKEEQGITLIALIITIIVLVILAAVAINTAYNTGIIEYAIKGTEDYAKQAINENKVMEETTENMSGAMIEVKAISRGSGVADDSKVKAGEIVTKEGGEGTPKQEKNNYTDLSGKTATIPAGFKVSTEPTEQLIDNGLVIQDEEGNEFVWVPCYYKTKPAGGSSDLQEYKRHVYVANDSWQSLSYTDYNDWTDEASDETEKGTDNPQAYGNKSVKSYGGFYIARYEAGWSENDTSTFTGNTYPYIEDISIEISKKNETDKKPVSKPNVFSWNFISQVNAKTVADKMYGDDAAVDSKLVDGAAWDTVVNWIASEGTDVTNSKEYGNCANSGRSYSGWYAEHVYAYSKSDQEPIAGFGYAKKFTNGKIDLLTKRIEDSEWTSRKSAYSGLTETTFNTTNSYFETRIVIPTGTVSAFALKNIYDLAGNVHEWTVEVGKHGNSR